MTAASSLPQAVAGALLRDLAAAGEVLSDPELLEGYRRDQASPGLLAAGMPAAVVRARTTAEVQAAVRAAARHGVPVVPRGAGSGLTGGANALDGCVVLCTERMDQIVEIDEHSLTATVQAGVVNARLTEAVGKYGLWYAPDPASYEFSTIGGNVATNAGGLCCVKYGVTRDSLLGVEVVLADGRAMRLGRRTRKGVVGYDLTGLICGSEGTLAVITEATVRLLPTPGPSATLAASFPDVGDAGRAIARIVRGRQPSLLELMDRTTVCAVEKFQPMGLDGDAALVFAKSDSSGGVADVEWMAARCQEEGATVVATSDEAAEGRMLMAARRLAYPALERLGTTLLDDVAVPLGAIPDLIEEVETIAERHGVLIATFGHAGDGNMHPTVVYDHHDAEATLAARAAFRDIVEAALRLGGTASGEHGIGALKQEFVTAELGESLGVHQSIKHALDPGGLFNPGRAL